MTGTTIKQLFDPKVYQELIDRINKLTPDSQPLWGKMNVAQMLAHCAEIQKVINGKELKNTPWYVKLFSGMIKKSVVGTPPYKKNLPTHPQYIIASEEEFEASKNDLLTAMEKTITMTKEEHATTKHALFGKMTNDEKGIASYKHNDHHLSQFGV